MPDLSNFDSYSSNVISYFYSLYVHIQTPLQHHHQYWY
jgi:hypothetical protein